MIKYLLRDKEEDITRYLEEEYTVLDLITYTIGLIPLFIVTIIFTPFYGLYDTFVKPIVLKVLRFRFKED